MKKIMIALATMYVMTNPLKVNAMIGIMDGEIGRPRNNSNLTAFENAYASGDEKKLEELFKKQACVIYAKDFKGNTLLHRMAGKYNTNIIARILEQARGEVVSDKSYKEWLAAKNDNCHGILCTPFSNELLSTTEHFPDTAILLKKAGTPRVCINPYCDPIVRLIVNEKFGSMIQCLKEGFSPIHALKQFPEKMVSMLFAYGFLNKGSRLPWFVEVKKNTDIIARLQLNALQRKHIKYGVKCGELLYIDCTENEWQHAAPEKLDWNNWNSETYVFLNQKPKDQIFYYYDKTPSDCQTGENVSPFMDGENSLIQPLKPEPINKIRVMTSKPNQKMLGCSSWSIKRRFYIAQKFRRQNLGKF